MSRPLVVAQAPSSRSDPSEPLSGASGRRLAALCGLELDGFLHRFERVNLLPYFPGRGPKGDHFHPDVARMAACQMTPRLRQRHTVLLGWHVARAFHMDQLELFTWQDEVGDGALVAVAPHPSGISHWWNEPANVRRAQRFWRKLVRS